MRNSAVQDVVYAVDEAYWRVVSLAEKEEACPQFCRACGFTEVQWGAMLRPAWPRSDSLQVEVKYNEACMALTKVTTA